MCTAARLHVLTVVCILATTLLLSSPGSLQSAYAYNLDEGYWWHADSQPVYVYFDNTIPQLWLPSLKAATEQYNAANTSLSLVYGNLVNGAGIWVSAVSDSDWNCRKSSLGCMTPSTELNNPSKLRQARIQLNITRLVSPDKIAIPPLTHHPSDIFIHELGHAVGLDHVRSPSDSVMYCPVYPIIGEICDFAATNL